MPGDPDLYFVPAQPGRSQLTDQGSKFIAAAGHAATGEAAALILHDERRRHPDASHHCYAWSVAGEERTHDDGEPSGTAGLPILDAIRSAGVGEVAVVVTRYFGGTKLGKGGLRRAYHEAARGALAAAGRLERYRTRVLTVSFVHDDTSPVHHVADRFGARQVGAAYGERVALQWEIKASRTEAFRQAIMEATSGRAEVYDTTS